MRVLYFYAKVHNNKNLEEKEARVNAKYFVNVLK
jgi:hypothetical protein